jgi:hypothetical protein
MDIQEVFEDRKGVIRGRTLKNDRQKENEDTKEYSRALFRRRTYMQRLKIKKE